MSTVVYSQSSQPKSNVGEARRAVVRQVVARLSRTTACNNKAVIKSSKISTTQYCLLPDGEALKAVGRQVAQRDDRLSGRYMGGGRIHGGIRPGHGDDSWY